MLIGFSKVEVEPLVETTNEGEMSRICLLLLSATAMLPSERTAIPYGSLNRALVPIAFVEPDDVLPASVVTIPLGVTRRIRLFKASAMT